MEKLFIGNSDNKKYEFLLEEVVSNHVVDTALFESAVFFIASNECILAFYRVGFIPSFLIEAVSYFQNHFTSNNLKCEHGESLLLAAPFSEHDDNHHSLYIGVIVKSELEYHDQMLRYLEGLTAGLMTKNAIVKNKETTISLKGLLAEADYQIEFTKLAQAMIDCYETCKQGSGQLIIVKRNEEQFIPLFYPSDVEQRNFKEVFKACTDNKEGYGPMYIKDHTVFENDYHEHVVFRVLVDNDVVSLLIFSFQSENEAKRAKEAYPAWMKDIVSILQKGYIYERRIQEGLRRDILLQVIKKFHSTMDIGEVLREIVYAIEKAYPNDQVHLLLSLEWEVSDNLPIKPLMYGAESGSRIAEQAYLTGLIQMEKELHRHSKVLYVPLRGKQGVYGLLEIQTAPDVHFPQYEIDFIQLLADTGGNALENAELYQQSRNLIHDLQLINETSHQLNRNLRLADTINYMTQQIIESFEAEQVGFIMFPANGESVVLDGSTSIFKDKKTLRSLEPFIQKVKRDKDPVYIGDTHLHTDFQLEGYKSVLTIPMIQNNELMGIVMTVHQQAYHFTFENFKLLQSLIDHSTLAFTNSMLHEELEQLVITDYLTKLYSRNHLDERIQESMNQEKEGTFLLIDIDNFKQINDVYGHQVGDNIIIQVANIMRKNIRDEDIAARWGGEELAIYLPKVEMEIGYRVAKRIVQAVSIETSPNVTISIGVSYWHSQDGDRSLKRLFNQADRALYKAKETGKNQAL